MNNTVKTQGSKGQSTAKADPSKHKRYREKCNDIEAIEKRNEAILSGLSQSLQLIHDRLQSIENQIPYFARSGPYISLSRDMSDLITTIMGKRSTEAAEELLNIGIKVKLQLPTESGMCRGHDG